MDKARAIFEEELKKYTYGPNMHKYEHLIELSKSHKFWD